jgi:hypothetical protein
MISQQIKDAILNSGKTAYQISKDTGVAHPILSRFLSTDPAAHRDIRLEKTADKLAAYFGLTLQPDDQPAAKPKPAAKAKSKPAKRKPQ